MNSKQRRTRRRELSRIFGAKLEDPEIRRELGAVFRDEINFRLKERRISVIPLPSEIFEETR